MSDHTNFKQDLSNNLLASPPIKFPLQEQIMLNSQLYLSSQGKKKDQNYPFQSLLQQDNQESLIDQRNCYLSQNILNSHNKNDLLFYKDRELLQIENKATPFMLSLNNGIEWYSFSPEQLILQLSQQKKKISDVINSPLKFKEFGGSHENIKNVFSLSIDSFNKYQQPFSELLKSNNPRNELYLPEKISEFHPLSPEEHEKNQKSADNFFSKPSEPLLLEDMNDYSDFEEEESKQSSNKSSHSSMILENLFNQVIDMNELQSQAVNDIEVHNQKKLDQQNITTFQEVFLLPGDFLIDLSPLYSILKQTNQTLPQEQQMNAINNSRVNNAREDCFFNSDLNLWKQCSFIEKDSADNGSFYLTINNRIEGLTYTPLLSVRGMLDQLFKHKQELEDQLPIERIIEFNQLFSRISSQINSISKLIGDYATYQNIILEEQKKSKVSQNDSLSELIFIAERQAKAIMQDIVNIHGSSKSFVFGKLITVEALSNVHHTVQHIYSPKLVSILFGLKKRSGSYFVNQVLRNGLIDFLGNKGQFMLNQLEIAVLSQSSHLSKGQESQPRQRNQLKANSKLNLHLRTAEGLQVPITVTMKKYPLTEHSGVSDTRKYHTHFLLVFDIKIKIKYQKQLKNSREISGRQSGHTKQSFPQINLQMDIPKSQQQPKIIKKIKGQFQFEDLKQGLQNMNQSNSKEGISSNYYEKSKSFLNKFYPEALKTVTATSEKLSSTTPTQMH